MNGLGIAIEGQAICSSQITGDLVCVILPSSYPSLLLLCGWFVDSRYALKGPYDATAWVTPSALVEHSCTWEVFAKGQADW